MVYRFVNGNFELLYYIKVENNQGLMRLMIEKAFDNARKRWEEDEYADFLMSYFEDELDKRNLEYKMVDEFTVEW